MHIKVQPLAGIRLAKSNLNRRITRSQDLDQEHRKTTGEKTQIIDLKLHFQLQEISKMAEHQIL